MKSCKRWIIVDPDGNPIGFLGKTELGAKESFMVGPRKQYIAEWDHWCMLGYNAIKVSLEEIE